MKLSAVILVGMGSTYLCFAWKSSSDPCKVSQLKTSQIEIGSKDRSGQKLHLAYGFGKRLKRYLRHVKNVKTTSFYKRGHKLKPSLVSSTVEFKSKKRAKLAFRYLQSKWERKKDKEHAVVIKDKTVILYRNSYSSGQCFYHAVNRSNKKLGIKGKAGKKEMIAQSKSK